MLEEPRAELAFCKVVLARRAKGLAEVAISGLYCTFACRTYEERQGCSGDNIAIFSGNGKRERHVIDTGQSKEGQAGQDQGTV